MLLTETLKGQMMRDLRAAIRNQPPAEHPYDQEALHTPGSIQPYGVLLVVDPRTRQVQFVSENAATVLGVPTADILDRSYLALCDSEREKRVLKEAIAADTILFPNPLRLTVKGRSFDAVFHAEGGAHLIEIEPTDPGDAAYGDMANHAVEELFDPGSVEELYRRAVRVVRDVTGFDRVMLYRFDARFNGQVLAESVRDGLGSFLGLFFPSGDITARARELYTRNFTRYIPDIAASPARLVGIHPGGGAGDSAHPVDMTHANLRSVYPCHITYLNNIGVKASMSFSITIDGRLWGLFACHHYASRRVSYEQRVVCEQTAMMFIFKLTSLTSVAARIEQRSAGVQQIGRAVAVGAALSRRLNAVDGAWADPAEQVVARPMVSRALAAINAETSWLLGADGGGGPMGSGGPLSPQQRLLLDLVEADSAAVVRHGHVYRIGDAPPELAIFAVASMFGRELPDLGRGNLPVFAADNLSLIAPVTAEIKDRAAGLLAVSLADDSPAYLMWFRREQIVHATWAGNPAAEGSGTVAQGLNPRASFAAWKQDVRDLSRPWTQEDVEVAYDVMSVIRSAAGASRDVSAIRAVPTDKPGSANAGPAAATPLPLAGVRAQSTPTQRRVIRVGQL
jgi:light-regulated signal transduction histidine kinase (bacteriophytochrome)